MLADKNITDFLQELSTDAPTPGGGSVSALMGSSGAALLSMVANLTIGKEKYKDSWEVLTQSKQISEKSRTRLIELIDEDANAFNAVMDSFKMPKDTEEQKAKRTATIQSAMKKAADVPLQTMNVCAEALKKVQSAAEAGNPNVISDAGVAAVALNAAIKGAYLNVLINLNFIKDDQFNSKYKEEADKLFNDAESLANEAFSLVLEKL